ncbi:MAG: hypothetical protein JEZ08_17820 [Clostridiales bacterium]|nr:hypothetical protein [Clostridiales bacterium]
MMKKIMVFILMLILLPGVYADEKELTPEETNVLIEEFGEELETFEVLSETDGYKVVGKWSDEMGYYGYYYDKNTNEMRFLAREYNYGEMVEVNPHYAVFRDYKWNIAINQRIPIFPRDSTGIYKSTGSLLELELIDNQALYVENGTSYIPYELILDAYNFEKINNEYINEDYKISLSGNNIKMTSRDSELVTDIKTNKKGDVPVKVFCESLGLEVYWNPYFNLILLEGDIKPIEKEIVKEVKKLKGNFLTIEHLEENTPLPYEIKDGYGLMTETLEAITKRVSSEPMIFDKGYAVIKDTKYGLIDQEGQIIMGPTKEWIKVHPDLSLTYRVGSTVTHITSDGEAYDLSLLINDLLINEGLIIDQYNNRIYDTDMKLLYEKDKKYPIVDATKDRVMLCDSHETMSGGNFVEDYEGISVISSGLLTRTLDREISYYMNDSWSYSLKTNGRYLTSFDFVSEDMTIGMFLGDVENYTVVVNGFEFDLESGILLEVIDNNYVIIDRGIDLLMLDNNEKKVVFLNSGKSNDLDEFDSFDVVQYSFSDNQCFYYGGGFYFDTLDEQKYLKHIDGRSFDVSDLDN